MIKKLGVLLLIILATFITYQYSKPPFEINNTEARDIDYKVRPFRDSMFIYTPYKITIFNNRLSSLKISSVYDGLREYRPNLLYNDDGMELGTLFGESRERFENELFLFKIKYSKTIFPFTKRDFYYYKKYTISNKNDLFGVKNIPKDSIYKQLAEQDYNVSTNRHGNIIDSLYKTNDQKVFVVYFYNDSGDFEPKYVKTKINSNQQLAVNISDSIQNMNLMQKKEYLLKVLKTNPLTGDF
ncbi:MULTISPECIES: hypothetical protein [Zobellia]|uniref:Hypothetical periplasmic protein n=1 Tax=Zobellia galactanivorans (strain DSM 12802 / CCUG 47099 / CIP 106680 / NCIMB 13871 / Dsij) TaxID=63186 RepID=G0L4H0_ZOBGA|nr:MULTISPECIES: hypothetical protein [Zobellia]OWW26737.1 hypothetical protein B4Q04_03375 [Zobellia sp. OII3]CAZ95702.1 Hypothetical periplasmic protein [Zobellia galactanivorans]